MREDQYTGQIYIQNARQKPLRDFNDALETFNVGMSSRRTAGTDMNERSSRSHLIFGVMVQTKNHANGEISRGKVTFVDLAGSERAAKANGNIERQKEANYINVSLSALGNVISTLTKNENVQPHIYRTNMLTKLMKDSLGGTAKTLMFVNVSPADYNANESFNSLRFGENVKQVTNKVAKNNESTVVQQLKHENRELRMRLGEF